MGPLLRSRAASRRGARLAVALRAGRMRYVAGLLLALLASGASAAPPVIELSERDRAELLQAATGVRSAILRKDVGALLKLIGSEGLMCTDTQYSYTNVRRDLYNRSSHLYLSLFDSVRFAAKCGADYPSEYPAKSDQDFFEHMPDSPIDVTFAKKDYATVTYRSTVKGYYPLAYSFHKEQGRWKLVEGLIVGNCTCG